MMLGLLCRSIFSSWGQKPPKKGGNPNRNDEDEHGKPTIPTECPSGGLAQQRQVRVIIWLQPLRELGGLEWGPWVRGWPGPEVLLSRLPRVQPGIIVDEAHFVKVEAFSPP